ncbi:hypothetical protein GCM10009733_021010 [Nonomuraea maheshkhaliensis]|uniref:Uncharacterized protein n=1 Tax=Nonomuraea maheshkhaliensis TaxID=419590 RepID=A0ABN2EZT9_9ACTN
MATTIPAEYPAEETQPGTALQRVNAINPHSGKFSHQVVYLGTERQARAVAEIGFWDLRQAPAQYNHLYSIIAGTIRDPDPMD